MEAEFFDIFGLVGFLILTSVIIKYKNKKLPGFAWALILLISLIGLIVDGYVVLMNFII